MRRMLAVGCPGASKSTFARRLGERLSFPAIHVDLHHWHGGWQPSERSKWREKCSTPAAPNYWIMDVRYYNTYDMRRADTHRPRIVIGIERNGSHLAVTRLVHDREADTLLLAHGTF